MLLPPLSILFYQQINLDQVEVYCPFNFFPVSFFLIPPYSSSSLSYFVPFLDQQIKFRLAQVSSFSPLAGHWFSSPSLPFRSIFKSAQSNNNLPKRIFSRHNDNYSPFPNLSTHNFQRAESSSSKFSLRKNLLISRFEKWNRKSRRRVAPCFFENKQRGNDRMAWRIIWRKIGDRRGDPIRSKWKRVSSPSVELGSLSFKTIHRISLPSTDTNAISRGISIWKNFSPHVFRRRNDHSCSVCGFFQCLQEIVLEKRFLIWFARNRLESGFSRGDENWSTNIWENRIFDSRCFRASPRCLFLNSLFERAFNFVNCETAARQLFDGTKKRKKWVYNSAVKIRLKMLGWSRCLKSSYIKLFAKVV